MNPLLDVKNLYVRFKTPDGVVTAVNDLNFTLNAGSTLGIVGESGSGKSQTAFALMGLLAANGEVEGSAIFEGKELVNLPNAELNKNPCRANFHDFPRSDDITQPLHENR